MKSLIVLGLALILSGCQSSQVKDGDADMREMMISLGAKPRTPNQEELEKHPLGSKNNPIRVQGHAGREAYLANLVCENGSKVSAWNRIGSVGESPYGFMMDLYNIICDTKQGVVESSLYIDMYHNSNESRPASGFFESK